MRLKPLILTISMVLLGAFEQQILILAFLFETLRILYHLITDPHYSDELTL